MREPYECQSCGEIAMRYEATTDAAPFIETWECDQCHKIECWHVSQFYGYQLERVGLPTIPIATEKPMKLKVVENDNRIEKISALGYEAWAANKDVGFMHESAYYAGLAKGLDIAILVMERTQEK